MKIIVDSREKPQAIKSILAYFDRHGIEYERVALKTGDYMLEGREDLIIDRKQSLGELATNLCSPDRRRFYNEIRRAHDEGIQLIILCEHGCGIKTLADVKDWKNKYGKVTGRMLQDKIYQLQMAYSVPVLYCDKRSTGRRIVEILTEENNGHEQPE